MTGVRLVSSLSHYHELQVFPFTDTYEANALCWQILLEHTIP